MLREDDRQDGGVNAKRSEADLPQGPAPSAWQGSESELLSQASEANARTSQPQEARKPNEDKPGETPTPGKTDQDSEEKKGDVDDGEEKSKPGFIRRHPFVVAAIVILFIVAAVGFGFYWYFDLRPYETSDDAFIDARQFAIAPKIAGYISEVPVTDNQFVGAGSPIIEIDDRDYRVALEQSEAQVAGVQATFKGLEAQVAAQQAQVEEAKAEVVQAQAQLGFAQADAARYQELAQKGAGTVQQAQQSTANLKVAQANLAKAQATVTAAQKQITALLAQQSNGSANLLQAKAQLDQARLNLTYTTVKAAQSGTVVRLSAAKGAYAQAGQNLAMFVPSEIWITANYKETQITDMRPGQPVDIEIDAYPGRDLKGHIDSVQPGSGTAFSLLPAENATGNYVKVVQRIPVKIVFNEVPKDIVLGPGMSVVPSVRVR